jgi:hypothetical protein
VLYVILCDVCYCIVLYCIVLYCTVFYCPLLHCTAMSPGINPFAVNNNNKYSSVVCIAILQLQCLQKMANVKSRYRFAGQH